MIKVLVFCLTICTAIFAKKIPFEKNKQYSYSISTPKQLLGNSCFEVKDTIYNNKSAFCVKESLFIENSSMKVRSKTFIIYSSIGKPLKYIDTSNYTVHMDSSKSGQYVTKINFIEKGANIKVLKDSIVIKKNGLPISADIFHTIQSNHIGQFSMAVFFLSDILSNSIKRKVLHIGSYKMTYLQLNLVRYMEYKHNQELIPAKKVEYLIGDKKAGILYISRSGILIKDVEQNGDLVIELKNKGSNK